MATRREPTIDDLRRVEGKAELVDGEIVVMAPAGGLHGFAVTQIVVSLAEHARRMKRGHVFGDNVGFVVDLRHRRSFSPDAAFHVGPRLGADVVDGAPVFAVEVRSQEDYGSAAEQALAAKRADYFAAGTLVVWDVDVLKQQVVCVYRASGPARLTTYRRGEVAEAEPAVPGWSMPVEELFPAE